MKQTAVDWLLNEIDMQYPEINVRRKEWMVDKSKEMEKDQRIVDYNAGHSDGLCNHINDADNYINEQNYLKGENID